LPGSQGEFPHEGSWIFGLAKSPQPTRLRSKLALLTGAIALKIAEANVIMY
jgi:hypothetical protein